MIEHDELADYSSLRRELRTIYGEGAPRKGESWPAYYLRLIADDRAAAEARLVPLTEALREIREAAGQVSYTEIQEMADDALASSEAPE